MVDGSKSQYHDEGGRKEMIETRLTKVLHDVLVLEFLEQLDLPLKGGEH